MKLSKTAKAVLKERYLLKGESPKQMFERVARCVASLEPPNTRKKLESEFLSLMLSLRFIPNSPTLMNAGKPGGQLSACFVLPIGDSLESIYDSLKDAALIHHSGGGTGFSFSKIRPRGGLVKKSGGYAAGPVGFLELFNKSTDVIRQGGKRRGANMGILRVDHPDILEFIRIKSDPLALSNFNLSVGITDQFMKAYATGKKFDLVDPRNRKKVSSVSSDVLMNEIALAAWNCGDPGLIFLDEINRKNPTPDLGDIEATNPCGEQPLLPNESCNLGSISLPRFFRKGQFDWKSFENAVGLAIRFLDNVIDLNSYPTAACEKISKVNRKIGLGVMGFADLLLLMALPYDSEPALQFAERVMKFLDDTAKNESAKLARERGSFKGFSRSIWKKRGSFPLRNATVSTVAPTGTISIIAGVSSGIEPLFSAVLERRVLDGRVFREVHPELEKLLKKKSVDLNAVDETIAKQLMLDRYGKSFRVSSEISVDWHIRVQAALQRYSDSAVSKTINLPSSATVDDVKKAFFLAHELKCKGITVYRDGCKVGQVLTAIEENSADSKRYDCIDC